MSQKILLSGVKPTGKHHIGNYFGALKQFVDLQHDYKTFVMIADYHALNLIQNKDEMRQNIIDITKDYLAIGLDPKKTVIFKQSDVPAHTELAWIFDTITTMPYLARAHAFKDAEAKSKEISVGTFNYPMLMASDILLYDADVVPVGQDQKQHIEIARDTAQKFNHIFGDIFKLPEPLIMKEVAVVPGIDGQKMSKSYNNTIPLFGTDEEIKKAVMGIVTDSGAGIPENVYAIHKLFRPETELKDLYAKHAGKYKELKEMLLADIVALVGPMREKRSTITDEDVLSVLKEGGAKANSISHAKIQSVKQKIGVNF